VATLRARELFGMKGGRWTSKSTMDGSVLIRDADGHIVFVDAFPVGMDAAKSAWSAAPLGSIQQQPVSSPHGPKAMLYGFRELWAWGSEHCGFPPIQ